MQVGAVAAAGVFRSPSCSLPSLKYWTAQLLNARSMAPRAPRPPPAAGAGPPPAGRRGSSAVCAPLLDTALFDRGLIEGLQQAAAITAPALHPPARYGRLQPLPRAACHLRNVSSNHNCRPVRRAASNSACPLPSWGSGFTAQASRPGLLSYCSCACDSGARRGCLL